MARDVNDKLRTNADIVREALSEAHVFLFYGHGINDGIAINTRHRTILKDGALMTTRQVADQLSHKYLAYGLIDPENLTATSYARCSLVFLSACNSHRDAATLSLLLRNSCSVPNVVGYTRTMSAYLGARYAKFLWEHFGSEYRNKWRQPAQIKACAEADSEAHGAATGSGPSTRHG